MTVPRTQLTLGPQDAALLSDSLGAYIAAAEMVAELDDADDVDTLHRLYRLRRRLDAAKQRLEGDGERHGRSGAAR